MDYDLLDTNKIEFNTTSRQTISKVINDVNVTNYKKIHETFVSINSKDRVEIDNKPNNYLVNL